MEKRKGGLMESATKAKLSSGRVVTYSPKSAWSVKPASPSGRVIGAVRATYLSASTRRIAERKERG